MSLTLKVIYAAAGGLLAFLVHSLNLQATKHVDHVYQYAASILVGALVAYFIAGTHHGWLERTSALETANADLKREMEERLQAEMALRESEERFRDLFDNSVDLIQVVSSEGKMLYANLSWRENIGIAEEEVEGFPVFDIIHPDQHAHCMEMFKRMLSGEKIDSLETEFVARDGRRICVEGRCNCRFVDGKPVSIRGIFRDVTESRQMEKELQKAQKLESIGILAGGIAHDFNNLLSGLVGVVTFVRSSLPPEDKMIPILLEAQDACMQGKELTSKFLTFAEGGAPFKKCISIALLLEKATGVALSGSSIECEFAIPLDLWRVYVDENQMQQVINNLVINAREAMGEKGLLKVKVENTVFTAVEGFTLPPGKYVRISFTDQGVGIPPDILSKIFDPYFTTKNMASRRGMGFGLSICYSIIKKHEGLITVESQKGMGTSFHIFLPSC